MSDTNNWIVVVVDINNPMAWKTLNFDIEIVKISKKWEWNSMNDVIEKWDEIAVHYTGSFIDGEKFDSSLDRDEPLNFVAWIGQMIPGFDQAVLWIKVWEKKSITLEPKDAYWERDPNNTKDFLLTEQDVKQLEAVGHKIEKWGKLPTQVWELDILEVK